MAARLGWADVREEERQRYGQGEERVNEVVDEGVVDGMTVVRRAGGERRFIKELVQR